MRYLPVFVDLKDRKVIVSGSTEAAIAKIRVLLKTPAHIKVFAAESSAQIESWAHEGAITLFRRPLRAADATGACLLYAGNSNAAEDMRVATIGEAAGVMVNVVDNAEASAFITPAIVDRDPVVIAIGTEGSAPVLARRLKAQIERAIHSNVGALARAGKRFRPAVKRLAPGQSRRAFWIEFYDRVGPNALSEGGEAALESTLETLLYTQLENTEFEAKKSGKVWIVGAGPGDPELLTLKARKILDHADVVVHDRLISADVLELARREATFIEVGKTPGGQSWSQTDINALLVEQGKKGNQVVRLKSGDPAIYGRLDEEMDALDDAGISFEIVPGITAAMSAAARGKLSLTRRGRNSEFRFLTGQDVAGFAEQDWWVLARPGSVAAIYMGVRAARFLQGRLLMHGADPDTPITVVENISRCNERLVSTHIGQLEQALEESNIQGPAIILLGVSARNSIPYLANSVPHTQADAPGLKVMGASL